MSTSNQTAGPSTDNFTAIFNAASNEYLRVTGNRLDTHPFAAQFDTCHSPEAISNELRTQAQAFGKFYKGDEKLMAMMEPTIHILFAFSAMLGEGIGLPFSPAKTIFTGIGILLGAVRDVAASHARLIHLFERINFFLQRLNIYTEIPLTIELTELLGKIMAQLLSILAFSTKEMADRKMKKVLKRLLGRTDVEDTLQRLDSLTKEESLMAVTRNLEITHHVDGNVTAVKGIVNDVDGNVKAIKEVICDVTGHVEATKEVIQGVARIVDDNMKATKYVTDELKRNQLQEKLRAWLAPPDPSINHNNACKTQHSGTARWFVQGGTFREWKNNGSLLWVHGNPGAGKSILCSAIIEDVNSMREARSALIAYYYFAFQDASKRDVRGLLTSLLFQLGDDCDRCQDILFSLYTKCHDGSKQPSDAALTECLKGMLELPGQLPVFIIVDALDECPNTTGTPSAREEVLEFVEDLVGSKHSNLFICVTSRPEQDIQTVLSPLTSASRRVSLHEEGGQREDIDNYILSFVLKDRAMRRWREEDRELVITTLSQRADGMFRWVFCQLDTLRRCMPSGIRKALNELPTTLDDTYERALQGIPKEKWQHAHRLFQCLVAAIRPLLVKELAEIFAIKFDPDAAPDLMEGWRPKNPEEAVLSACSTLISIVETDGSKIVQFSHFSVKEYLTSDRLRTSEVGNICIYHIPLDAAHSILARACLAVLLQLDENMDKERLATFPLAFYAAQHWVHHAKFEDVALRIQDDMERLFNPRNPYLASWYWIYDVEWGHLRGSIDALAEHPTPPDATALYFAALCGFTGVAEYLITTHAEDVNAESGSRGTPMHAASHGGHVDVVRQLLRHYANVNSRGSSNWTPLHCAAGKGQAKVVQLLLEHGADVNALSKRHNNPLRNAVGFRSLDVVQLLLGHGADVHVRDMNGLTPYQVADSFGQSKIAQLLLEHGAEKE